MARSESVLIDSMIPSLDFTSSPPRQAKRRLSSLQSIFSKRNSAEQDSRRRNSVSSDLPINVVNLIFEHFHATVRGDHHSSITDNFRNFSLVNRRWERASRPYLYSTLQIPLVELHPVASPKVANARDRFQLLRTTLRRCTFLGDHVREIHILDGSHCCLRADHRLSLLMIDALASLIALCPNLERLIGICALYVHDFSTLTSALSACHRLQEMIWIVGPNGSRWNGQGSSVDLRNIPVPLAPYQVKGFVDTHRRWKDLSCLVLASSPDGAMGNTKLFTGCFKHLPSLKHLCVAGFNERDFGDAELRLLPRKLASLRLENLPGVSQDGLVAHFKNNTDDLQTCELSLRHLILLDLNIHSFVHVAQLLRYLKLLVHFTIRVPTLRLPQGIRPRMMRQPCIDCPSLEQLDWHLMMSHPSTLEANKLLAGSAKLNALPQLKRLSACFDPSGILQNFCRPMHLPPPLSLEEDIIAVLRIGSSCTCVKNNKPCVERSLRHARAVAYVRALNAVWPGWLPLAAKNMMKDDAITKFPDNLLPPQYTWPSLEVEISAQQTTTQICDEGAIATSYTQMRVLVQGEDGETLSSIHTTRFHGRIGYDVPMFKIKGLKSIEAVLKERKTENLEDVLFAA